MYNIDEIDQNGALRLGRYKLIEGRPGTIGQDVEETDDLNIYDEAWERAVDSSDMSPEGKTSKLLALPFGLSTFQALSLLCNTKKKSHEACLC